MEVAEDLSRRLDGADSLTTSAPMRAAEPKVITPKVDQSATRKVDAMPTVGRPTARKPIPPPFLAAAAATKPARPPPTTSPTKWAKRLDYCCGRIAKSFNGLLDC